MRCAFRSPQTFVCTSLSCWSVGSVEAGVWFWTFSSPVYVQDVVAALKQVHPTQKRPSAEEFGLQLFSGSRILQIWCCQSDLIIDWLFPMCTYSAVTALTSSSAWFYTWFMQQPIHRVMSGWNPRGHPHFVLRFLQGSLYRVSGLLVPRAVDIPGLYSQSSLVFASIYSFRNYQ